MKEFDLIQTYFAVQTEKRADISVGIGDDAAVIKIPEGNELAITTDTLVADVHFRAVDLPYDIGYKSLAVNLSDLAAMGADAAWVTLTLTLPNAHEAWIQAFCEGFFTLANRHQITLIGGDLTHGPLSITLQALGVLPPKSALLRSGAKPKDLIYVSGTLGDAGLALLTLQNKIELSPEHERYVLERLHRPEPRLTLGKRLRGLAHAAIDISDGFAADLGHILKASNVGALIHLDRLPLSEALKQALPHPDAVALALTAGDDYELCFTIPAEKRTELEKVLSSLPIPYTCVGEVTEALGLNLRYQDGSPYHGPLQGYEHF